MGAHHSRCCRQRAVCVERSGSSEDGEIRFTSLNGSWESPGTALTVDAGPLDLAVSTGVEDMVTGEALAATAEDGRAQVAVPMGCEQVRLVALSTLGGDRRGAACQLRGNHCRPLR